MPRSKINKAIALGKKAYKSKAGQAVAKYAMRNPTVRKYVRTGKKLARAVGKGVKLYRKGRRMLKLPKVVRKRRR